MDLWENLIAVRPKVNAIMLARRELWMMKSKRFIADKFV